MAKLFIPILLGTVRPKRESIKAAHLVEKVGKEIEEIEVQLVDPNDYHFPFDGNDPENKDPKYTALTAKADGFFIVTPEYNHSFPGLLKHALDMNLKEYIHKAVGICGVSAGIMGGPRVIESLLPVMRELGLVTIFEDVNFGRIGSLFDERGNLLDENFVRRVDAFLNELIWMSRVLRHGRENVAPV